jgi:hypothetical protein
VVSQVYIMVERLECHIAFSCIYISKAIHRWVLFSRVLRHEIIIFSNLFSLLFSYVDSCSWITLRFVAFFAQEIFETLKVPETNLTLSSPFIYNYYTFLTLIVLSGCITLLRLSQRIIYYSILHTLIFLSIILTNDFLFRFKHSTNWGNWWYIHLYYSSYCLVLNDVNAFSILSLFLFLWFST